MTPFQQNFSNSFSFLISTANLQFRTLPRQQQHINVNGLNMSECGGGQQLALSVIPSPATTYNMNSQVIGHHTIRRSTQSGIVESMPMSIPTSMQTATFYPRPPLSVNTSQLQQQQQAYFYGWQQMSPVPSQLHSPVVCTSSMPQSILKPSVNYQKPIMENSSDSNRHEDHEKHCESTWVTFKV